MAGRWLIYTTATLIAVVSIAILIATTVGPYAEASLETLREERVIFLEEHHIFLVYNDGDPLALSDDAQHLDGEHTEWCERSQLFQTPTHGETFDRRGYYYSGPASKGLDRYPVEIDGDQIRIDLDPDFIIPGPERGAVEPLPPVGALCFADIESPSCRRSQSQLRLSR